MQITYEADDIKGFLGCIFHNENASEFWLLGYDSRFGSAATVPRYQLVSLRDGMVQPPETAEKMAALLTESKKKPLAQWQMAERYIKQGKVGVDL